MRTFALVLLVACSHPSASQAPSNAAAASSASVAAAPASLVIAPISFEPPGKSVTVFQLAADGTLTAGAQVLGQLTSDGKLTFAGAGGAVVAQLGSDGTVEIRGPKDVRTSELPGDLANLLRSYDGVIRPAYIIEADRATISHNRPATFDDHDVLDNRLHVTGLTPATKRTALFVYVVLSAIMP